MNIRGFTLVEILLAAFVTLGIMMATTATLMDFLRNRHQTQSMGELIITGDGIINHLTQDLQWGENGKWVYVTYPPEFSIDNPDPVIYKLDQGNLLRNGEKLNNSKINVTTFIIEEYSSGTLPLWRINLKLIHKDTFIGSNLVTFEQQTSISTRLNEIIGN
jgi:hypothetical protein